MYLKTVKAPFTVNGIGLHTGKLAIVNVKPSDNGKRTFLVNGTKIDAIASNVVDTRRSTMLGCNGATIQTVEHILAALYLAGVDSCEIEVDGTEIPVLNGSARQWHKKILSVGTTDIDVLQGDPITIDTPEYIIDDGPEFLLLPAQKEGALSVYYGISIKDTFIESMIVGGNVFDKDTISKVVSARTYGLESEVKALLAAGLALGGTIENAIVIGKDNYLNDDVTDNEPAWHKLLDFMGDISLVNRPIVGTIVVLRGGHRSHVNLAKKLVDTYKI